MSAPARNAAGPSRPSSRETGWRYTSATLWNPGRKRLRAARGRRSASEIGQFPQRRRDRTARQPAFSRVSGRRGKGPQVRPRDKKALLRRFPRIQNRERSFGLEKNIPAYRGAGRVVFRSRGRYREGLRLRILEIRQKKLRRTHFGPEGGPVVSQGFPKFRLAHRKRRRHPGVLRRVFRLSPRAFLHMRGVRPRGGRRRGVPVRSRGSNEGPRRSLQDSPGGRFAQGGRDQLLRRPGNESQGSFSPGPFGDRTSVSASRGPRFEEPGENRDKRRAGRAGVRGRELSLRAGKTSFLRAFGRGQREGLFLVVSKRREIEGD